MSYSISVTEDWHEKGLAAPQATEAQRRYEMKGRFHMQGGKNERDECKPVFLELSLAGNLVL
jgi:hypothetical protein